MQPLSILGIYGSESIISSLDVHKSQRFSSRNQAFSDHQPSSSQVHLVGRSDRALVLGTVCRPRVRGDGKIVGVAKSGI